MIDPIRASRILGLEAGGSFSKKVVYIYRKQLEEAEIILVNKTDLLTPERLAQLLTALKSEFPLATILPVSARDGAGIDDWIALLSDSARGRRGRCTSITTFTPKVRRCSAG